MLARVVVLALLAAAPVAAAPTAAVLVTNYDGTGAVATLDAATHAAGACSNALCGDLAARYAFGRLFVIGRYGCDNIQVLDPANGYATVTQFSVGNGSNPQDLVAISPRRAYVSRYGSTDVWIVDPVTGAHTGTVSLAAYADADGIPEMAQMALVGGRVFVALQRLDQNAFFTPTDYSALAVIDTTTNALVDCDTSTPGVQALRLTGTNPVTDLVRAADGTLFVGEAGNYGVADGGVDAVDVEALLALGFRSSEATLGGDILDVDVLSATQAYAIVSDESFVTQFREFHAGTGALTRTLASGTGFDFSVATLTGQGDVLLADRSTGAHAGVRDFVTATGIENAAARRVFCEPPIALVMQAEPVTAVAPPSAPRGVTVRCASVARGEVRATLALEASARDARVGVVRVDGARVRELARGPLAAGARALALRRPRRPRRLGTGGRLPRGGRHRRRTRLDPLDLPRPLTALARTAAPADILPSCTHASGPPGWRPSPKARASR